VNSTSASSLARGAKDSPVLTMLARGGYAVNGLLHILIGAIAIGVAAGIGGEADQSGALTALAGAPGGAILLWVIVVGLTALALWQFLSAFLIRGSDPKKRVTHTVKELAKGLVFLAIAITAFTFARGGSSSSTGSSTSLSAKLLATPGGVFLLIAVGLGILAVGVYFIVSGVTERFTRYIRVPAGDTGRIIVGLGRLGYVAKGIAVAVVGILFVIAGATSDSSKATGLDGALRSLRTLPFGVIILVVVGAGVIAYGVYCFARARLARL
jgi:hypothetical protein